MKKLSDIGEFGFIDRISELLGKSPDVIEGVGDDCAMVRMGDALWAISTDMSVEGIHFHDDTPPKDVGWKAMASALSDIAAMGCHARFALVSISTDDRSVEYLEKVYEGLNHAAEHFNTLIIGGDTTRSPQGLVIDVTVLGEAVDGLYKLRSGAATGDLVAVTGWPGRSRAGLTCIEIDLDMPALIEAHRRPTPRMEEGIWLAQQPGVRAMMDVSDGLVQDVGHLAEAAQLGVAMTSASVAVDPELLPFCSATDQSIPEVIFAGGEDYELALVVEPGAAKTLITEFRARFNLPLTVVGLFTEDFQGVRIDDEAPQIHGYEHFRNT